MPDMRNRRPGIFGSSIPGFPNIHGPSLEGRPDFDRLDQGNQIHGKTIIWMVLRLSPSTSSTRYRNERRHTIRAVQLVCLFTESHQHLRR